MGISSATLTIDLDALARNYLLLADKADPAELAAVVKADAYGLGVKEVAEKLVSVSCQSFFVAHIDEGVELRAIIPEYCPIYVFHGVASKDEVYICIERRLTPVLNHYAQLELWKNMAAAHPCVVHIDTGMNRLGFNASDLPDISGMEVSYVMSHFACANEGDEAMMSAQLKRFNHIRKHYQLPVCMANSAATWLADCYHFDLCRAGLALYGSHARPDIPLHPVVTIEAPIIQLREVDSDGTVGYGATAQVKKGDRLAVIPVGYADGLPRSLSNHAEVMVNGMSAPVIGRLSMDLTIINVTNVKAELGDRVEMMGWNITVDEVAEKAGTIGYEILTGLGNRYKRVYLG